MLLFFHDKKLLLTYIQTLILFYGISLIGHAFITSAQHEGFVYQLGTAIFVLTLFFAASIYALHVTTEIAKYADRRFKYILPNNNKNHRTKELKEVIASKGVWIWLAHSVIIVFIGIEIFTNVIAP